MNKVLFISLAGERSVFEDASLDACIDEANRINKERGYHGGVHVVEQDVGYRMSAAECREAASNRP